MLGGGRAVSRGTLELHALLGLTLNVFSKMTQGQVKWVRFVPG